MKRIVGIDLGTTNSVIAFMESGEPKVISNEEGARVTPSVVGFTAKGETLVGELARRQAVTAPTATVYSIKRFMGQRFDDVEEEMRRVGYEVVAGENGDAAVRVHGRCYAPPEVAARVLMKLKRAAELYLGEEVTEAVITVPAYFNDAQRKATRDAGQIAGFDVKRIINEPTAAALSYGLDKGAEELVAVFDFGGGTFDISILEVGGEIVEVLATNGDFHLGGDDIDAVLVELLYTHFHAETGIDLRADPAVLQRLREAAERAKIELSSITEAEINLPFLTADARGPRHLNMRISRADLEHFIAPLVERAMQCCERALSDAGKSPLEIEQVLLVGGSTRIPLVQKRVTEFFGREPHRGLNPDEVVALGAAIQGAVLSGRLDNILLLDVTPLSLGLETRGGIMTPVIPRNTSIPTRRSKTFSTTVDNQSSVEMHVCQGEHSFAKDNRSLGRFELGNVPPGPRATPQIEVAFDVDANGILLVTAQEMKTGQKAEIRITGAGGLSTEDVRRAVQDAATVEDADRNRRRRVELRNKLLGLTYNVGRDFRELFTELSVEKRNLATETLERASAADSEEVDFELLQASIEEMLELARALAEANYARQRATMGDVPSEAPSSPPTAEEGPKSSSENDPN